MLKGGLGNQLFQLFAAARLAVTYKCPLVCTFSDSKRACSNGHLFHVPSEPKGLSLRTLRETREFAVTPLHGPGVRLDGYFQHAGYFHELFDECASLVRFKQFEHSKPGTVVHVRRTDYVSLSHIYVQLPLEYYTTACHTCEGPITIVTDCVDDYVRELATLLRADVRSSTAHDDFQFLCEHNSIVCANSTFSWWAGYLIRRRGGTAVLPPMFLTNGSTIDFPP